MFEETHSVQQVESMCHTDGARMLSRIATQVLLDSPENAMDRAILKVTRLKPIPYFRAIMVDGIRGSGKTTLIDGISEKGIADKGSRVDTEILTKFLISNGQDPILSVFSKPSYLPGAIADTLIFASHHYDRLSFISEIRHSSIKPLLLDRHTLTFMAIEQTRLKNFGADQKQSFVLVDLLSKLWPVPEISLLLDSISIEECDRRIIGKRLERGNQQRSKLELDSDKKLIELIYLIKSGLLHPSTVLASHGIYYIDAKMNKDKLLDMAIEIIQSSN